MQAYPKLHDTLARLFNHLEHSDDETGAAMAREAIDLLPRWIPVTERLPECKGNYLVTDGGTWAASLYDHINDEWDIHSAFFDADFAPEDITHWGEPPKPPKP